MMSIVMMMMRWSNSLLAFCLVAVATIAAPMLLAAAPSSRPTTQPFPVAVATTRPAALQPASITMHLKDVHPRAVFAELGNQLGANFRPSPAGLWEGKEWPAASIDLENVSFWTALREISGKTGLYIQRGGVERNFFVVADAGTARLWTVYPTSEHGQFLFSLQSLDRSHKGDFVTGQTTRQLNIRMMLFAEPKLRVLKISPNVLIQEGVDELGNQLTAAPNPPPTGTGATWGWGLSGRVNIPPQVGTKIAALRGAARLTVQTQSQIEEIAEIQSAGEVERIVAGHKLVVKNVRARGETYTVTMTITRDPARRGGWGDINLSSTFRMVDANGMPLSRRNYGGGVNLSDHTELSLIFGRDDWNGEGAGAPAKLIWEVPTQTQEIDVPFSFEDVPLPW